MLYFPEKIYDLKTKVIQVILTEALLNDGVVGDWDTVSVNLGVSTLVKKIVDGLVVWVSPSNVWLDDAEKWKSSLVQLDEDSVVDLTKTEDLESLKTKILVYFNFKRIIYLSWLWMELVDTANSDHEGDLVLSWDVEVSLGLSLALESESFLLSVSVLLNVLLSTLEVLGLLLLVLLQIKHLHLKKNHLNYFDN